jgi:hypothetical protein
MCVTGEEWLRQTFDPALRTSKPPYGELRTELGALALEDGKAELKPEP